MIDGVEIVQSHGGMYYFDRQTRRAAALTPHDGNLVVFGMSTGDSVRTGEFIPSRQRQWGTRRYKTAKAAEDAISRYIRAHRVNGRASGASLAALGLDPQLEARRMFELPPEAREVVPIVIHDVVIYTWERGGYPAAAAFVGKQGKSIWSYRFRSPADRDKKIAETIKSRRSVAKTKQERKVEAKKPLENPVKVGDIFYTSWGYDQTNVDFYQVVRVSPSGASADLQKIGKRGTDDGQGTSHVMPDPDRRVGSVHKNRRIARGYRGQASLTVDDHHASPWDGKPKYESSGYAGHAAGRARRRA